MVPPEAWEAAKTALHDLPDPPTRFERDRWRTVMSVTVQAAFNAVATVTAEREEPMKIRFVVSDKKFTDDPDPKDLVDEEEWEITAGKAATLRFGIPWLSDGGYAKIEITP